MEEPMNRKEEPMEEPAGEAAEAQQVPVDPADPATVPKFVAPVPRPAVAQPAGQAKGRPLYEMRMEQFLQQLHPDFAPTTVWGFNGTYPGPTIEARRCKPVVVRYLNNLPTEHLLPVVTSIHGAEPFRPEVRNVTHLHGGNVPDLYDGHPEAWFTPGITQVGPAYVTNEYVYPNQQPPTTLWYHDHALGITRLNVYAGLAGFYLLRSKREERLMLPSGEYEWPLLIQDRTFTSDAQLFYPAEFVPEFFGNTILVNGRVWPFLEVEPRRYRFRFLNGSNSRFYRMRLDPPLTMVQIGSDQGFLPVPVPLTELLLAPGQRADVIIDFADRAGSIFTLTNDAPTPFPNGDPPEPSTTVIMQFRVTLPLSGPDESRIPAKLPDPFRLKTRKAVRTRDLTLNEVTDDLGRLMPLLGVRDPVSGQPLPLTWGDFTTERPRLGDVEIWNLINVTMDAHPIHLHLVRFLLVDRQPFDVDRLTTTGELVFTGPPIPPEPQEEGPMDTVIAPPGLVTRIITRFCDFPGDFVWHCHILEHEDHEMMRPMEVLPGKTPGFGWPYDNSTDWVRRFRSDQCRPACDDASGSGSGSGTGSGDDD